jgi:hemerythrin-like metal-binding protein
MALIEWRDEFAVGVAAVDHEHREMIDLINTTYQRLVEGESSMTVGNFLGEIYAKISAHFALEEKLMRDHHYDQYTDHKEDHERLLDDIRDIMDDFEMNDAAVFDRDRFAQQLRGWFSEHFKTRDARLHQRLGI